MEYGLIGEKLSHSFSKEIHAHFAGYTYELCELTHAQLKGFMQKKEFKAINVTIPYKQAVIPFLDFIDDAAKEIGAVNTVVNNGGKLFGYNTDFYGMRSLIIRSGISLNNKTVLILGSGGTSKTATAVAKSLFAKEIFLLSRSEKDGCITYETACRQHSKAEIIINTTPCGMFPNKPVSPIDIACFDELEGVFDVIYNPLKTELLAGAEKKGVPAFGGLYMLVAQAAAAVEKFTKTEVSAQKTEEVYNDILRQKQNVVLIGMPASGKTTVGKILAKRLKRKFIDVDAEIVKKAGLTIPEIFEKSGEEGFRSIETDVIKTTVSPLTSCVISTGGGAVLNPENIEQLKRNGRVFFLDRPLELLTPTKSRPLSQDSDRMKKLFDERYEKYLAAADKTIDAKNNIRTVVRKLYKEVLK